jgi:hypothetical protein
MSDVKFEVSPLAAVKCAAFGRDDEGFAATSERTDNGKGVKAMD